MVQLGQAKKDVRKSVFSSLNCAKAEPRSNGNTIKLSLSAFDCKETREDCEHCCLSIAEGKWAKESNSVLAPE
jgi:hypothetical protein